MATWAVKKRLVNPARKKKNRASLSPKQIKFFGTPQQKAALKRKRRNAAMLGKKTKRVSPKVKRRKRRTNIPGAIITAGLAGMNPAAKKERRTQMSKPKTKKRRSSARPSFKQSHRASSRPKRRKNGMIQNFMGPRRKKAKRRANPSLRSSGGLLKNGLFMLAGLVGSRLLPQMFLAANNTGVMGYGANLAIALGGGFATKAILKDSQAGNMFILGGIGGIILRAIQDFTPFGQAINTSLQGVGDVGIYGATTFFVPLAEAGGSDRGQMALPGAVTPQPTPMPAKTTGVGGGGRYQRGRFA